MFHCWPELVEVVRVAPGARSSVTDLPRPIERPMAVALTPSPMVTVDVGVGAPPLMIKKTRSSGVGRGEVTFQLEPSSQLHHPRHEAWIRQKGNSHSPAHREVMFALSGEKLFGLCGDVYLCSPGSVFLFDHYESRDYVVPPDNEFKPNTVLWLHFFRNPHCTVIYNTHSYDGKDRKSVV